MTLPERGRRNAHLLYLVLFWMLTVVFSWFFHKHGDFMVDYILLPVMTVLSVYWLVRHWKRMKPAEILLGAFAGWYLLTRLLNANPFTVDNLLSVMEVLAAVFIAFPLAAGLDERDRQRAPLMIGALIVFLIGVIAWIAVIAVVRQEQFIPPLTSNMTIGINAEYSRLDVLHMHPNLIAVMFSVAFGLCMFLAAAVRSKGWRALIALAAVGLYLAAALTVSRTAMVVVALELGGFAYLTFVRLIKQKRKILRRLIALALGGVITVAALFGMFASIDLVNAVAEKGSASLLPLHSAQASPEHSAAVKASSQSTAPFIDRDHVDDNVATLSSRTDIYAAVIPAIEKRPITLLIGNAIDQVVPALQEALGWVVYHWHESFIQVLMTAGLPALLLILAFSGLLIAKGVSVVLDENVSIALQALVIPVAGLFLHGLVEAFLFVSFGLQNTLFFLLSGFLFAIPSKHNLLTTREAEQL